MASWSNGQDTCLSSKEPGFDSPWSRGGIGVAARMGGCEPPGGGFDSPISPSSSIGLLEGRRFFKPDGVGSNPTWSTNTNKVAISRQGCSWVGGLSVKQVHTNECVRITPLTLHGTIV